MFYSLCIRFLLCKPYKGRDVMKMCFGSLYWKKIKCHVRKSQSKEIWLKTSGSKRSRRMGRQALLRLEDAFFWCMENIIINNNNNKNITQSVFYSHLQSKPAHLKWFLLCNSLLNQTYRSDIFPKLKKNIKDVISFFLFFNSIYGMFMGWPDWLESASKTNRKREGSALNRS